MTLAERIRQFAFENYVVPMRDRPNAEIRIRAGDVHKGMGLGGRMPAVCGALDAMVFRRDYGLELAQRTGPAQGANVEYVFRKRGTEPTPLQPSTENNTAASLPRIRFTLRGKSFEKAMHDFVEAVVRKAPTRIQRYSALINGVRYPIRQVVACATGLPAIAITSQDAYRILEKFGFAIESDGETAPLSRQLPAEGDTKASPVEPGTARVHEHAASIKIEVAPDIEAGLAARAVAEGVSLPKYVSKLLTEQLAPEAARKLSPAQRAAAWREAAKGLPRTPPLSDEAISRESIYSDRG